MKKTDLRQVLARNLRQKMDQYGYTQPDVATRSGHSQGHISDILNGLTKVSLELMGDLAYAVHCEPWELILDVHTTKENIVRRALESGPPPAETPTPIRKKRGRPRKRGGDDLRPADSP